MAALAALAGSAAAQDAAPPQSAPAGTTTTAPAPSSAPDAGAVTTPATTVPAPESSTPTDLGTLEVQVDKLPPAAKKEKPAAKDESGDKDAKAQEPEKADDPFGGLPSPLLTPPSIGVPNVLLDEFRIPPFLLPLYQAAGVEYGVRWEVLAAINEIETDYGRNLSVSSAGAVGWMQFMPATWEMYGVDANGDRRKDPYNPVDAIFAAARYLRAAGAGEDLKAAIWAYNHADWYVEDVLARARGIAALPTELVGALTGLTMGRSPVTGTVSYAGSTRYGAKRGEQETNASVAIAGAATRKGATVYGKPDAAAIAVQDGKVVRIGSSKRLGRYVRLRDAYGNTYTYGHLGSVADVHAVPLREDDGDVRRHAKDPTPTAAATAGTQGDASASASTVAAATATRRAAVKERLFAEPQRPNAYHAGGQRQLQDAAQPQQAQAVTRDELGLYLAPPHALRRDQVTLRPLREGSRVIAGTILGRLGATDSTADAAAARAASKLEVDQATQLRFEIRPAGAGAPRIDPTPILDGWKLLDTTDVYRSASPMLGADGSATIGQILLMSKELLERRVLANPAIDIYGCGRQDIRAGIVDRRVLATLEFLAASGMKPTVTSLRCGHGYYTKSGNVSHHSFGAAVDIAAINGTSILGHQGEGSITDIAVRRLLSLQGSMRPAQIITLMQYAGTDNTYAMGDHDDHIHVGFQPRYGANAATGRRLGAIIKPGQWSRLIGRLSSIQNPTVPVKPSRYAIKVKLKTRR
jgi:soluble lytic murein transglycosylase-like protein